MGTKALHGKCGTDLKPLKKQFNILRIVINYFNLGNCIESIWYSHIFRLQTRILAATYNVYTNTRQETPFCCVQSNKTLHSANCILSVAFYEQKAYFQNNLGHCVPINKEKMWHFKSIKACIGLKSLHQMLKLMKSVSSHTILKRFSTLSSWELWRHTAVDWKPKCLVVFVVSSFSCLTVWGLFSYI